MDLISSKDLVGASKALQVFGGEKLAKIIFRLLRMDLVNKTYSDNIHLPPPEFLDKVLEDIMISYTAPIDDLKNIPPEG